MPVLGLVRSPSVEHGIDACELVTEHGGLGHTSAVYARTSDVIDRFAEQIHTGRILVNAPTAVGATGGVYNSMTPTFSLGCGTWGGSIRPTTSTTATCSTSRRSRTRQTPPQWFRVPSDTYFNVGAIENLRQVDAAPGAGRHRRRHRGARRRSTASAATSATPPCTSSPTSSPEPTEEQVRAGVERAREMRPTRSSRSAAAR